MCGRFTLARSKEKIIETQDITLYDEQKILKPSFNITHTHKVPVVFKKPQSRVLSFMQWGLIPFWPTELYTSI